jgi:selenium-binding protein 1
MTIRPDPTFHASPKLAMEAPPENFAYTLMLSPDFSKPDALAVIDVKPGSPTFSQVVHTVMMPNKGDEFHHFGWNACSSALSPLTGHAFLERRYLIIPGIRSSRIYIVDTKPDPTKAKIHKIIEPEEIFKKTGYSRPHTVHCGPEGIYVSTLGGGGKDGTDGPPGVFIMDCETFDVLGRWEIDRGPQKLHYDFWWNLPRDYMVTSEWALPPQFENGIVPEDLLSNKYGHRIHFWDLRARRNVQTIDLGANHQMALEVRPAHDPVREYGFLGVVVDTTNLEGSIWTWWREGGKFHIEKTATIPAEPAPKDQLPPLLQGFGAVPPLVTDIDLSMDDKFLYVACWGTGEMRQYDVTDPSGANVTNQRSVGGNLLTGTPFETYQASAKAQMLYCGWTLFVVGSMTGPGSNTISPFGANPNYATMQQVTFDNANEKAIGGSIAYDFGTFGFSGLSTGAWYTHGWDAINTSTNSGTPNRNELDLWIQYCPTEGPLKGFRLKMQYANVWQQGNVRSTQPEFQFIVDYTVLIRPPPLQNR